MTDCSFQKKGSYLSLNAVTNEQHLKGAIARALLWRGKRKYLGKYEAKTLYFWVYCGAAEKDKHSWERASQRVAGTTVVLLRAAACLVQWEGSSSQCPPSVWAPRTFQPKRQEHPASWGIVPGCTWSQTWKDIQRSIWIMRRSEKLSNRVEEAQKGRDN